jgi:EmrB/QacA subfamily drug resistance transporter
MATIEGAGERPPATAAPAAAPEEAGFAWTNRHSIALAILCVAQLLDTVDVTIVNVALPTLKTDLHFSEASLSWVVNAYVVMLGGFLMLGGRAGDVLGRRKVFLWGTGLFAAASLVAGIAQNSGTLIVARGAQGVTGAFIAAMTLAMIASIFPEGKPRNTAMGIWGMTAGLSGALGVTGGGLLVTGPGWRWIFLVNIPLCLLILGASFRYLDADRPERHFKRFDVVGAIAVTSGVSLLTYAFLQTSEHAWGSGRTIGLIAGAVVLIGYFVVHEINVAGEPLFDFSLLRNRSVLGANIIQVLSGAGLWATFFFATLFEQDVLHYSALKTGLLYLPMTAMILIAAGLGPVLLPKIGMRAVLALGAVIDGAGTLLFARIDADHGVFVNVILPTLVIALGFSLLFVPLSIASVSGVSAERTGIASALLQVSRQVGGALGFAVLLTIATARTNHLAAGSGPDNALVAGFQRGFVVGAILLGVAAVGALFLFGEEGKVAEADTAKDSENAAAAHG